MKRKLTGRELVDLLGFIVGYIFIMYCVVSGIIKIFR